MNILYNKYKRLARALGEHEAITPVKYNESEVDASNTAFLYYPPVEDVRNPWSGYAPCRRYFWYHKRGQRRVLEEYFPVAADASDEHSNPPYIVRPLRHFGGREFYVAHNDREVRQARREIDGGSYAVALFRRTREFRAFFVGGEHTTTMLKSLEGYGYADSDNMPDPDNDDLQCRPWNRSQMETSYLTISRSVNDKLGNTNFYTQAHEFLQDYPFDILAIDAAYNDQDNSYIIFETNFAPQCTVETSLNPMRNTLLRLPQFSEGSL